MQALTPAYAGGTSNLLHHLEAKHLVDYEKTGGGESSRCASKKQSTPSSFHANTGDGREAHRRPYCRKALRTCRIMEN